MIDFYDRLYDCMKMCPQTIVKTARGARRSLESVVVLRVQHVANIEPLRILRTA